MEKEDLLLAVVLAVLFVVVFMLIFVSGKDAANGRVATECQKLGAFYVGDKVYECKEKAK